MPGNIAPRKQHVHQPAEQEMSDLGGGRTVVKETVTTTTTTYKEVLGSPKPVPLPQSKLQHPPLATEQVSSPVNAIIGFFSGERGPPSDGGSPSGSRKPATVDMVQV